MKKLLCMILALLMALSLVACGGSDADTDTDADKDNSSVASKVEDTSSIDTNSTITLPEFEFGGFGEEKTTFVNSGEGQTMTIETYHKGCLVNDSAATYELTDTLTPYRYVLSNQLYESGLEIVVTFHTEAGDGSMDRITVEDLNGTLQTEKAGFNYYNGGTAYKFNEAHVGGVTFDILDREMKH